MHERWVLCIKLRRKTKVAYCNYLVLGNTVCAVYYNTVYKAEKENNGSITILYWVICAVYYDTVYKAKKENNGSITVLYWVICAVYYDDSIVLVTLIGQLSLQIVVYTVR